jgi:hypothetical protein
MKLLSQVLESISNTVTPDNSEHSMSPHGSIKKDGLTNIQITTPRNLPTRVTPVQNQQIMNALSSLASVAEEKQNGRWGTAPDGQYDFIPSGAPSMVPMRRLNVAECDLVEPLLSPSSLDIVRVHLGRLALIKKIGSASEMTMPSLLNDMAFELCEFSELAVLLSFRELKRAEGPWLPDLGSIIRICEKWQAFVDQLYYENFKRLDAPK